MARNKISDLRDHLFEMIENIKDAKKPEDVDREIAKAKAISDVAEVIIDSAKVEVQYLEMAGFTKSDSEFLKPINEKNLLLTSNSK